MKRGIISKALTGTMVLLLAGGCNTVYEWWDVSSELKPQEPVVPANPPAAEPPPRTNSDSAAAVAHPVSVVPAELIAAPQVAVGPSSESKSLPPAVAPVPVNSEGREEAGFAQAKEAEDALARAKERLDWATGIGARNQFPTPYTKATAAYDTAVKAKRAENWQETKGQAGITVAAVAEIEALLAAFQAREAEDALARAKERLDWVTGIGAKNQFPVSYTQATSAYSTAVKAKSAQNWHDTVSASQATVAAVAEIESLLAALQAREAEDALARAKERLDWVTGIGAQTQFPTPYMKASIAYSTAIKAKTAKNWQDTKVAANITVAAVAEIESLLAALQAKEAEDARKVAETDTRFIPSIEPRNLISPIPEKPVKPMGIVPLKREPPAAGSYIVKPGDSYWAIASQIYGDAKQWKLLYETNKHTMKTPDNPHLIFPGMVLTIPSM
ncbi:MAG: LysM peptidoglycan-binding domain-containing protein [Treponema sp.]|jgi:nucleoid-associated protein YgaU|nr:LysM peptidoglycan-binding domain-containing protein [Treponema sp.]